MAYLQQFCYNKRRKQSFRKEMKMKKRFWLVLIFMAAGLLTAAYLFYRTYYAPSARSRKVFDFLRNPAAHQDWVIPALTRCGDAPFIMPTTGMVGFIWDDSFRPGHRHQGIDIFSGTDVGQTPVYSAYEGYLTRKADWKSSVIIRIPSDPLNPGRQIWMYYTHMADPSGESLIAEAFPPGSSEIYIPTGTLIGTQGNYSGTPGNPTGVHLHFSIVRDDGEGVFLNELNFHNTLDPSPYFGMALNAGHNPEDIPLCEQQ